MMRTSAIVTLFCTLILTGCGKSDPAPVAKTSAGDSKSQLTMDPATTFAQSCARCHGPQGQFYALPFKHQGQDLRNTIRMMMIGNAQLNPTEADIDAMLQYHLQIRERLQTKPQ